MKEWEKVHLKLQEVSQKYDMAFEAIHNIAPWLSASLSDGKSCKEYIAACNAIFELDNKEIGL